VSWLSTAIGLLLVVFMPYLLMRTMRRRWPRFAFAGCGTVCGLFAIPLSFFMYLHLGRPDVRYHLLGMPGAFLFAISMIMPLVIEPLLPWSSGEVSTVARYLVFMEVDALSLGLLGVLLDACAVKAR
jgi:hypothetical protein